MKWCVGVVRGLAVVGVVLGGAALASLPICLATALPAVAQTVSSIVVEGNRRVETETIRSYFHGGPGGRLDAAAATRLPADVT